MNLRSTSVEGVATFEMIPGCSQLEAGGSSEFVEGVLNLLGDQVRLLIDLSGAEYMNSRALGVLVSGINAAIERGVEVRLTGLSAGVREVFRVTRLDRIYDIHRGRKEAIASFLEIDGRDG